MNTTNKFLTNFALTLNIYNKESLVFRIYGDDFVVLSNEKIDLKDLKIKLDAIFKDTCLEYESKSFDLQVAHINSASQLENIE